jgi:hypothetical protein
VIFVFARIPLTRLSKCFASSRSGAIDLRHFPGPWCVPGRAPGPVLLAPFISAISAAAATVVAAAAAAAAAAGESRCV